MKLFTTRQIATLDRLTIEKEPVADIDLMERAARALSGWLLKELPGWAKLQVLAGAGNNGGDALAVARHWCESGRVAEVYLLDSGKPLSPSAEINRQRLLRQGKALLQTIASATDFPATDRETVILDGLFGSGLSRPLEGLPAALVRHLNASGKRIISVDIPSGLMGEDNTGNPAENIIRADITLTLQFPKLSFLFPENEPFVGEWKVLPIGLLPEAIEQTPSPWQITGPETIAGMLPRRSRFSHKGTFGHALLIAGSYGKMGAAVLASRAALRAGAGLLTAHVPHTGYQIIHTAVPEAMCS
ncbi:MAG TPA: NAD(P)H-hydrate epimerase, partial [Prolixibacteraceae bacterium]|nr:NAD(P)H-hydrate epimerase [Prolixibacteraceae bacterium]